MALSLCIALSIIAAVNLLSVGLLSARERTRDFGVQKTLDLTPGQIAISVISGVGALTLIGLIIGIPIGLAVYDSFLASVAEQIGSGSGFWQMDWRWLLVLLPGMVLLAILSSAIPARRAFKLEIAEALRYE